MTATSGIGIRARVLRAWTKELPAHQSHHEGRHDNDSSNDSWTSFFFQCNSPPNFYDSASSITFLVQKCKAECP